MKKLLVVLLFCGVQSAYVDIQVFCNLGGCFTNGSFYQDTDSGEIRQITCISNDCSTQGWATVFGDGTTSATIFKEIESDPNGATSCFGQGFKDRKFDATSGKEITITNCTCKNEKDTGNRNFLSVGWRERDKVNDMVFTVFATNGDAGTQGRNGVSTGVTMILSAECINGDSFGAKMII